MCEPLQVRCLETGLPVSRTIADRHVQTFSIHQMLLCVLAVVVASLTTGCEEAPKVSPFPSDRIDLTHSVDGETYHLANDGNLYREVDDGHYWTYHETIYNPDDFRNSYEVIHERTFRRDPDSDRKIEVRTAIDESFEDLTVGTAGLRLLVSEQRQLWGSFTVQTPGNPEVSDYVDLRNRILRGEANFEDGSVELSAEHASAGKNALRFETPACPPGMITCKASLSSPLLYFRNDEDIWYQADYWFEENLPLTIVDFECEFVSQHPGIRIRLYDDGALGAELKALDKPQYRQTPDAETVVPRKQWVTVKTHIHLSPTDGQIEIWQNGQQVLNSHGPTLPFKSAIYNSLELGISAYSSDVGPCVLYIDNVKVSKTDPASTTESGL